MHSRVGVKELARTEGALTGHFGVTSPALGRSTRVGNGNETQTVVGGPSPRGGSGPAAAQYELRPMAEVDVEVENRRRVSTARFELRLRGSRFDCEFRTSTARFEVRQKWRFDLRDASTPTTPTTDGDDDALLPFQRLDVYK